MQIKTYKTVFANKYIHSLMSLQMQPTKAAFEVNSLGSHRGWSQELIFYFATFNTTIKTALFTDKPIKSTNTTNFKAKYLDMEPNDSDIFIHLFIYIFMHLFWVTLFLFFYHQSQHVALKVLDILACLFFHPYLFVI